MNGWEEQMRAAAERFDYERAAALKQRIERARSLSGPPFDRLQDLRAFDYLVVQRGRGASRVRPFFVRAGVITSGEEVAVKQIEGPAGQWSQQLARCSEAPTASAANGRELQEVSEQIWLVSHFLFKKDPPGLFLRAAECANAEALADRVRERFRRPEKKPAEGS